jgi:hypothetical protein
MSIVSGALLWLWEHQPTICGNLALRFLLYFASEYNMHIKVNDLNIYGEARVEMPAPHFVCLDAFLRVAFPV